MRIGRAAIDIIRGYAKSWRLLNAFDEDELPYLQKHPDLENRFSMDFCLKSITQFKKSLILQQEASPLFGNLREHGLDQILGGIHQTFDGHLLYPSVYERAAHLFYFTLKDHPFTDGNKRIGSFLLLFNTWPLITFPLLTSVKKVWWHWPFWWREAIPRIKIFS